MQTATFASKPVIPAPIPEDEVARLAELHALELLDTRPSSRTLPSPEEQQGSIKYRPRQHNVRRLEGACRDALSPRLRARFSVLLELAQLYARLREEQVPQLTLGWPLVRRALRRLGDSCVRCAVIDHPDDIHFLERRETV